MWGGCGDVNFESGVGVDDGNGGKFVFVNMG